MKRIAVASGKGGTGKTTIAVNLLVSSPLDAMLVDADVEEPNAHLFLHPTINRTEKVFQKIPVINEEICDFCGACQESCSYSALTCFPNKVLFFPELCHACGLCTVVCPVGAITEEPRQLGVIESGPGFMMGKLLTGEATATPVIHALNARLPNNSLTIIDVPPGTACAMLAAIKPADYVLLVTEPTPFGLSDLQLAVEVCRKMEKKIGVIINRAIKNNTLITDYLQDEEIPLLASIPEKREYAESYSRGRILLKSHPELEKVFKGIWKELLLK